MKIKVAKDSGLISDILKYDRNRYQEYGHYGGTWFSSYSPTLETEDVTIEQLQEYINKGYGIKINC